MIVVMAKVSVIPEKKQELLELAKPVMETTRKEEGCVSYVLLDNPYDPGGCMFVEEWTDLASLQKHAAAPHMAAYGAKTREHVASRVIHVLSPL